MKFSVLQETLSKALNIALRFTSPKIQLPVLANILFKAEKNKLLVCATNLEISVALSVGARVEEDGEITVPARTVTELVSNLKGGQISFLSEKERIEVKCQGFESVVSGINTSDFPKVPYKIGKTGLLFQGKDLSIVLSKILFAVSVDETRPVLTGVLVVVKENLITFVSTDGFRLSQKSMRLKSTNQNLRIILPKSALGEVVRLLEGEKEIGLSLNSDENQVLLSVSNAVLSSRVIQGEFPDFEKILPKSSLLKIVVDKDEFVRAVKLASIFARDSANVVKIKVVEDAIEISAENSNTGSQRMNVDAKVVDEGGLLKKEFVVAFNYRFLEDLLNSVEGDSVEIGFSDSNAPAVFKDSSDTDYIHVIMPVKLQN